MVAFIGQAWVSWWSGICWPETFGGPGFELPVGTDPNALLTEDGDAITTEDGQSLLTE